MIPFPFTACRSATARALSAIGLNSALARKPSREYTHVENPSKRIGILTGGGDCPGLNAVIRAVVKTAWNQYGANVIGIHDGFEGVVEGHMHEMERKEASNILGLGGTILGSSNMGDPWQYPLERADGSIEIQDMSYKAIRNLKRWTLDRLIAIGGDGTMNACSKLQDVGIDIVGVPKAIDHGLVQSARAVGVSFGDWRGPRTPR